MLEILLAIGLIATAVLALMGLATTALNARQKSLDTETARQVARAEMGRVINSALEDLPKGSREQLFAHTGSEPLTSGKSKIGATEFDYEVYVQPLMASSEPNRLVEVTVKVGWWGGKTRTGMGQLQYKISQLLDEPSESKP